MEKDLGVLVASDMEFKEQITSQAGMANKSALNDQRNFEYMSKEMFKIWYGTLVVHGPHSLPKA